HQRCPAGGRLKWGIAAMTATSPYSAAKPKSYRDGSEPRPNSQSAMFGTARYPCAGADAAPRPATRWLSRSSREAPLRHATRLAACWRSQGWTKSPSTLDLASRDGIDHRVHLLYESERDMRCWSTRCSRYSNSSHRVWAR